MAIRWEVVKEETYCVDSGRPVRPGAGDRCLMHGAASEPCYTAVRNPRCKHKRLSKNHPYPKCEECGVSGKSERHTPR